MLPSGFILIITGFRAVPVSRHIRQIQPGAFTLVNKVETRADVQVHILLLAVGDGVPVVRHLAQNVE